MKRFRGGLVFNAHGLLYHSTLSLRGMKKKEEQLDQGKGLFKMISLQKFLRGRSLKKEEPWRKLSRRGSAEEKLMQAKALSRGLLNSMGLPKDLGWAAVEQIWHIYDSQGQILDFQVKVQITF